jgi:RHS repeat-associated protein
MYNEEGKLFWQGSLDSYGRMRMERGETGSCPFRYQGQYEDKEIGLYYNRFRYYSPEEGRYISQDPIDIAGGLALYAYVDDPNRWVDVWGLLNEGEVAPYGSSLHKNDG